MGQFFHIDTEGGSQYILNRDYVVAVEPIEGDFDKGLIIHFDKDAFHYRSLRVDGGQRTNEILSWLLKDAP